MIEDGACVLLMTQCYSGKELALQQYEPRELWKYLCDEHSNAVPSVYYYYYCRWWCGVAVARWSRITKLTYVGPS